MALKGFFEDLHNFGSSYSLIFKVFLNYGFMLLKKGIGVL